ncbi:hypothetical protein M501DRAFT_1004498 [Patellaria atrata CBS 101060]|uniref:Uncharacterized protein n=1 Tax=Patellaria atrata CBS 101060 TaxID=1346257 RepID=A0A9P4S9Q5_9PEZI|nr:hypothetical protein M501DRAFT_1004498 [Patellaria atrata CBS 101060]
MAPPQTLDTSLQKLNLSTTTPRKSAKKPKAPAVADSWEDEASSSSDTETETAPTTTSLQSLRTESPCAPPPTPASPTGHSTLFSYDNSDFTSPTRYGRSDENRGHGGETGRDLERRPEKTTAVAGRMIAAGLGLRAPKKTEEQRAYDKAMREKEAKRRQEEREAQVRAKEEVERKKRAVWED